MKEEAPNHLMKLIPKSKQRIRTKNNIIPSYNFRAYCFKFSFSSLSYQVTITEHIVSSVFSLSIVNYWFNVDDNIRNLEPISISKNKLSFICPVQSHIYNIFWHSAFWFGP